MTTQETDYSKTVNLPNTAFPQKAGLATSEPQRLQRWVDLRVAERLSARTDRKPYVLHDGPPYANGDIHIGHTLNKVLKDVIIRHKSMTGHRAHYVPGWDCHGLPIEQKVVDDLRAKKQYEGKSALDIRRLCAEYARGWVNKQREQFKRLGIGGDWEHPYITMDPGFEVGILGALKVLVERGFVYKGLKVVYWDPIFETALAEAEIEYNEAHVSPSIYVRFPFKSTPPVAALQGPRTSVVIWTTTPWTLPANLGVSVHPDFEYVAYRVQGETLVVAADLLQSFIAETGLAGGEVVERFAGEVLDRQVLAHPLRPVDSLLMLGTHVTKDQGTGAVHTAPGHGVDDFHIGARYGLPVFNPVDEKGCFTQDYPDMAGEHVFRANPRITELLKTKGLLVAEKPYTHKYPYSWRTRKPVIMRATEQWFMNVEKDGLREATLREVEAVRWIPSWGFDRIFNMIKTRPDWCLSRQRSWGVPIPSIRDKDTNESLLLPEVIEHLMAITAREGTDAWFSRPVEDFLPERLRGQPGRYEKEYNCLDVWFDSGSTHLAVLNDAHGLTWPADLYLEGSDQHRGWFQSSLWVAMGVKGAAPYKAVLTHGFVLDEKGQPMSKSLGNVINPLDVIKESGADILRMWVSSEDYREDVSIGKNSIAQIVNAYRRIRNTLRHMLGNLGDFDPARDAVAYEKLGADDQWALHQLADLTRRVSEAYETFEFHRVYQAVNAFCVTELGGIYLDITKDRLYCSAPDDVVRRATQTVFHHITSVLARLLAPVLVFTADEAWEHLPGAPTDCVHLAEFPVPPAQWTNAALAADFDRLLAVRSEALTALEALRRDKQIGAPLDAAVWLQTSDASAASFLTTQREALQGLLIVSQLEVESSAAPVEPSGELAAVNLPVKVRAGKAAGTKCARCWKWTLDVGQDTQRPELCTRCANVMRRIAP